MTDLYLAVVDSVADLEISGGDLRLDETLRSPILVSLFSDARLSDEDEVPDGSDDRRGWWGERDGDPFGSLLWSLERNKVTPETINAFQEAISNALSWLIREGIAEEVNIVVVRSPRTLNEIVATIEVVRGTARRWPKIWEGILEEEVPVAGMRVIVLTR